MNYSSFNVQQVSMIPDSVYSPCSQQPNECDDICSNVQYSTLLNDYVHDTQRGIVFCPFGKNDTMNKSTYADQRFLYNLNSPKPSTWGRVPQLDPRPLYKIGLEWK